MVFYRLHFNFSVAATAHPSSLASLGLHLGNLTIRSYVFGDIFLHLSFYTTEYNCNFFMFKTDMFR